MPLSRRNFLACASAGWIATGAAGFLAPLSARAAAPARFSADPFALGVASGDPSADGVVLWTRQFLEGGGTFVQKDFHTPADFATLKEKVVIHSTGFAAKALMNDRTMFPVRGQNARLTAQPEANYGVTYRGVSLLSKTGGVRFNASRAGGEMLGVGDGNEVPDRKEIEAGLRTIAPLFASVRA
jgi:hypothetical protein